MTDEELEEKIRETEQRMLAAAREQLWVGIALMLAAIEWMAFAQVQEQLAKVRTIQFAIRSTDPADKQASRVFVVEPDRYRDELPDGRVILTDLKYKQVMELNTKPKTGEIYSLYDATDRQRRVSEMISILRDAPGKSVETVGRRQVDGLDVIDFRIVNHARVTLKVTVDAATKLPVRIEWSNTGDVKAKTIATDFVFDQAVARLRPTMTAGQSTQPSVVSCDDPAFWSIGYELR